MAMPKINVGRYEQPSDTGFDGYIEPEDRTWILFIKTDGTPMFYPKRDPITGACLPSDSEG